MKRFDLARVSLLLLLLATITFGASCASTPPLQDDERPPVVVSSGSVVFDPTTGTFSGSGKKWKNKGKSTDGETVRFDVDVTGATCSTSGTLNATELILYATSGSATDNVQIYIDNGDLTIKAAKHGMNQAVAKGKVKLDTFKMSSVIVTAGTAAGTTCTLNDASKITINQKNQ